jgi:hypothetical protein
MKFTSILGIALSFYVLLNFLLLPRATLAWKDSRPLAKIGKAGLLSALQYARNLTLAASIVYLLFAFLTFTIGVGAGHNVRVLGAIVSGAANLHRLLESIESFWDSWFFLLPILITVVISWYFQTRQFKQRYERFLDAELDRLNEERENKPDTWDKPPDAAMKSLDEEIAKVRTALASLSADSPNDLKSRQDLKRREIHLAEELSRADYERRLRFDDINAPLQEGRDSLTWSRFFLSRGFFSDLKGISKILSLATLTLLTISLLGAASEAGLSQMISDRLVKLDDLRVELTKRDSDERWAEAKAEWEKAGKPALAKGEDEQAVQQLSNQFANALLHNPHWRTLGTSARLDRRLTEALTRRAILDEVQLPDSSDHDAKVFADGLSPAEHQALNEVSSPRANTRVASLVMEREGPAVKFWFGDQWVKAKQSILHHASLYKKPIQMEDLQDALLDHILSSTFEGITPDFGDDVIAQKARSMMTDSLKEAIQEAVTTEFRGMVKDLADGKSYEESLKRVQTGDLPFSRAQSEKLALVIRDGHLPDPENIRRDLSSNSGRWRPSGPDRGFPRSSNQGFGTTGTDGAEASTVRESMPPEEAKIVSEVANEATRDGKISLRSEDLEALANYEDFFPKSVASQAETVLGRTLQRYTLPEDVEMFSHVASLNVARAESFAMLQGFSRIGGVLIGREPDNPHSQIDVRDINWRFQDRAVWITLVMPDRNETFGPFDESLVHQALAYAADGRPVAVTMTTARPFNFLKIQLHPSFVDTPLGCQISELDRLVDTYALDALPQREQITAKYEQEVDVYNLAWSVRGKLLASIISDPKLQAEMDDRVEVYEKVAADGLKQENLFDSSSLFQKKPEFFDPSVVRAAQDCHVSPASLTAFENCVETKFSSKHAFKERDESALKYWFLGEVDFQPWSGVREKHFRIDRNLEFLKTDASASDPLWPFDFLVQIAFKSPPVNLPERKQEQYTDVKPVEFDSIKDKIAQLVAAGIARNRKQQEMFTELRDFAVLQRLFRVSLQGYFGNQFPLEKLPILESATAGDIPYVHTARWNGSMIEGLKTIIERSYAGPQPWLRTAATRASRCLDALARAKDSNLEDAPLRECDLTDLQDSAASACSQHVAIGCAWQRIASSSSVIPSNWRYESAFGVLSDSSQSDSGRDCQSLTQ